MTWSDWVALVFLGLILLCVFAMVITDVLALRLLRSGVLECSCGTYRTRLDSFIVHDDDTTHTAELCAPAREWLA